MRKTFTFKHPIKVNGREVKSVEYDEEELTIDLYNEACDRGSINGAVIKESNDKLHVQLFWACVIAVNPEIDFTTLSQIRGISDLTKMGNIGRTFIVSSEDLDQSESGDLSENTQGDTIQALPSFEDNASADF